MPRSTDILVLGAGPCGLGAAVRLNELGHSNYLVIESNKTAGGLASSWRDKNGFLWDIGGHVIFSHYQYFDDVLSIAVDEYNTHERESWVRMRETWIPYPLQNNIHRLPKEELQDCLNGIIDITNVQFSTPKDFKEWLMQKFGSGLCKSFLFPYNKKVWAYDTDKMNVEWMGERVATVNLKKVLHNVIHSQDEKSWGPNAIFKYPKFGGTGSIWKGIFDRLTNSDKFIFNSEIKSINIYDKYVELTNGERIHYNKLVSSLPLDTFVDISNLTVSNTIDHKNDLLYSSTNIIGIGLKGSPPAHLKTKAWMYFPEDSSLFYRCTVLSNYAKDNAPDNTWSLMFEVAESKDYNLEQRIKLEESLNDVTLPVFSDNSYTYTNQFYSSSIVDNEYSKRLIHSVIRGAIRSNLIISDDIIVSLEHQKFGHGYPTPFLHRENICKPIFEELEKYNIKSRGRFGAWKYEVSNQDHTFMQGVEAVDSFLNTKCELENEYTFNNPSHVNDIAKRSTIRYNKCQ